MYSVLILLFRCGTISLDRLDKNLMVQNEDFTRKKVLSVGLKTVENCCTPPYIPIMYMYVLACVSV